MGKNGLSPCLIPGESLTPAMQQCVHYLNSKIFKML